jgi:membrane protease YdiL (CAAX protease family)
MKPAMLKSRPWTLAGLALAFLGLPAVVTLYRLVAPDPGAGGAVAVREIVILALVGLLIWIVRRRERLPLSSIGIGPAGIRRSLAWSLLLILLTLLGFAACLGLFALVGVEYGQPAAPLSVSMWAVALTVIRAGIAEEVFYRGYAIERIEALTGSRWFAALVPLVAFAAFHYRQGWPGMFIALVLGAILTGFYLWKRNLVANMFAHFLVDFVPNVALPLIFAEAAS